MRQKWDSKYNWFYPCGCSPDLMQKFKHALKLLPKSEYSKEYDHFGRNAWLVTNSALARLCKLAKAYKVKECVKHVKDTDG